jgi:hypothetical protein
MRIRSIGSFYRFGGLTQGSRLNEISLPKRIIQ